jgi:hypothetical protein
MLEKAETLFHKLEEKLVALLSERDNLIRENQTLITENQTLKSEKELHSQKLHELVLLVESVTEPKQSTNEHFSPSLAAIKPLVAQGQA